MDYYGVDPDELKIKQMLAQAAALRSTGAPKGQMVGNGGFQHYVAPHWSETIAPVTGEIAAELVEGRAADANSARLTKQQKALAEWLRNKPGSKTTYGAGDEGPTMAKTPATDQENLEWAQAGMSNPLSRALAGKQAEDTIINQPIRDEKQADKLQIQANTNQRFDEDRKARAALAASQSADRLARLEMQLNSTTSNQRERLDVQQQIAQENARLRSLQIQAGIANNDANREQRSVLGNAKLAAAKGKLTSTQLTKLSEFEDEVARQQGLNEGFDDSLSGPQAKVYAELGGNSVAMMAIPEGEKAQAEKTAQWWRDFRANDNVERHKLFGSALTAQEKGEWARTTVTPMSTPAQIRDAIATRQKLSQKAMDRRLESWTSGGANLGSGAAQKPAAGPLKNATGRADSSPVDAGSFVGSPEEIMDAINSIADPVERDRARRSYIAQTQKGGGDKPKSKFKIISVE